MCKRFDRLRAKKAGLLASLTFLKRYRDNCVIPNSFKLKHNCKGKDAEQIYKRTSFSLLRCEISTHRKKLDFVDRDLYDIGDQLSGIMYCTRFDTLDRISYTHYEHVFSPNIYISREISRDYILGTKQKHWHIPIFIFALKYHTNNNSCNNNKFE